DGLRSRVEDGCLFILFNQNSAANPLSDEQRKYVSGLANPQDILSQLEQNQGLFSVSFAQNILPSWQKLYRTPSKETQLPKKMSIAVYDYYALHRCAICVSDILKRYGVEVEVNTYS
ncbi:SgrR family transcriptional regulator, partial [Vibrio sp. 10N.261.49.A5]